MSDNFELTNTKSYWFVGAAYSGTEDQTERFIQEGIWEARGKQSDLVKTIKAGEKIAIKSTYTRKKGVPFDNRGHTVSVMAIKAIGTVIENSGDGKTLKVDWEEDNTVREWYFFTSRNTVWKIIPETWARANLIDFAFHGKEQDIDRFRNDAYWRDRFGSNIEENLSFSWTSFYEEVADKILTFRNRREELIAGVHEISALFNEVSVYDKTIMGQQGELLENICPFTIMLLFNRGNNYNQRKEIAEKLAHFLGVSTPIPHNFFEIVQVDLKPWFFENIYEHRSNDIEALWDLFSKAISYADMYNECEDMRTQFTNAYDKAISTYDTFAGWRITTGLHWIRPWVYLSLDKKSNKYIDLKLNIVINRSGPFRSCSSSDYLDLIDYLKSRFHEEEYPVHSFPELSFMGNHYKLRDTDLALYNWNKSILSKVKEICNEKLSSAFTLNEFTDRFNEKLKQEFPSISTSDTSIVKSLQEMVAYRELKLIEPELYQYVDKILISKNIRNNETLVQSYTLESIIDNGCFLPQSKIEMILKRIQNKKNIILQGPPGTGKTWLAKRLAFALIGQRDDSKVRAVQFHPNLSYEDFIRGWRPSGEGKLTLVDGPFMEVITTAIADPESKYVIVIEEINRGNPAQVFGEMLTLLETDKRTPDEALELSYRKSAGERVYIPSNLYVIGTMNIADRSLALVDLALRRRFAFIDLEPTLGKSWRNWVQTKNGIGSEFLYEIERRINALNDEITIDPSLGAQFQVGHSYVTPAVGMNITDAKEWFGEVVETEIGPLLDEYWFDDLEKSRKAQNRLIEGL
ncbi:AAA family ATPase [Psychrobacter sp. ANT_H56B]|uniref:AAA family ATPase n=1 Tax=Psychrobacter sp. ANT_H56B TaxID=2597353 RepID=UPI0011F3964E|nr:AAA family ATPase [Psychrobacter sp. ANT_H56B]KAA0924777.1 AAA family ATPase [Psychrobacter sp. ANT_H56B]